LENDDKWFIGTEKIPQGAISKYYPSKLKERRISLPLFVQHKEVKFVSCSSDTFPVHLTASNCILLTIPNFFLCTKKKEMWI
jgi:hypothetical protein